MERLTGKLEEGVYAAAVDAVFVNQAYCTGPLVERLAAYENMHELIERQYRQAADRLETLKSQGRLKSAQAQQLLAQKLTYSSMLNLIE